MKSQKNMESRKDLKSLKSQLNTESRKKQRTEKSGDAVSGEVRISVRNLVEFILRHGDIDSRHRVSPENAMLEGGRIHRKIQRRMGAEYQAEVPLKLTLPAGAYHLTVEGRADGIIHREGRVIIDEIKGTYRDVNRMREPLPLHMAQAKCYAYIYGLQEGLGEVEVRLTYCSLPSEEIRYFEEKFLFGQLQEWFEGLINAYRKWSDYSWEWHGIRQASIQGLEFPFPYRQGQRELAVNVYRTIYHRKKLFLEAPTGAGKTITTIYPAVQAVGKGMGDKLFYLTAKTITRAVAEEALHSLRRKGLRMKSVVLTAKEKICFMEEADCSPENCPYAKGHYDRINDAVFDLLTTQESFDRERIEEYARRHQVCPFEMCLDVSLYADAVICDYNYLFDPHVYLKRFFGDSVKGDYLFLIDEAHNLLERGREMYSAVLWVEDFVTLMSEIKETNVSGSKRTQKSPRKPAMDGQITLEMTQGLTCESFIKSTQVSEKGAREEEKLPRLLERCCRELSALEHVRGQDILVQDIDVFVQALMGLHAVMEDCLSEQDEHKIPFRDRLLDFYFEVSHFLEIYELLDNGYVKYTHLGEDGRLMLKLFCVNPRENLKTCLLRGRSSILFSATFLPIQYYKKLLGGEEEDYEVYAQSVFSTDRRGLFVAGDVTSRYARRSQEEYGKMARYIEEIVKNRPGNYMVFCPSHAFLRVLHEKYVENYSGEGRECLVQGESMNEAEREAFLARFQGGGEGVLIGICVLGGIFGEGIDLKNDSLIGVIVAGTGLPMVCGEREILREHFAGEGEDGFDYAYRYPGMNKVLQAAGRVIRTIEDVGVIVLLDDRFLQPAYRRLFPREWENYDIVTVNSVAERVKYFWRQWT